MRLRCGGIFTYHFTANFESNSERIWEIGLFSKVTDTVMSLAVYFFGTQCRCSTGTGTFGVSCRFKSIVKQSTGIWSLVKGRAVQK